MGNMLLREAENNFEPEMDGDPHVTGCIEWLEWLSFAYGYIINHAYNSTGEQWTQIEQRDDEEENDEEENNEKKNEYLKGKKIVAKRIDGYAEYQGRRIAFEFLGNFFIFWDL